jgi:hypothetical protein
LAAKKNKCMCGTCARVRVTGMWAYIRFLMHDRIRIRASGQAAVMYEGKASSAWAWAAWFVSATIRWVVVGCFLLPPHT